MAIKDGDKKPQVNTSTDSSQKVGGLHPDSVQTGAGQAAVTGSAGGTYTATEQAMLNNTAQLANSLRTALINLGLIKGSA